MTNRFTAVYEHGLLRLTEPDLLVEGTQVEVTVVRSAIAIDSRKASDILAEIAALPMEPGGREFTGRDHDRILYGERGA